MHSRFLSKTTPPNPQPFALCKPSRLGSSALMLVKKAQTRPSAAALVLALGLSVVLIACGDEAPSEAGPPTLAVVENQVFSKSCAIGTSCHTTGIQAGALDLDSPSFDKIVNVTSPTLPDRKLVVPGDPDASYLFEKTAEAQPALGQPMPLGSFPIEPERLQLLHDWIAAGCPQ